jgi:hypothetical protein
VALLGGHDLAPFSNKVFILFRKPTKKSPAGGSPGKFVLFIGGSHMTMRNGSDLIA